MSERFRLLLPLRHKISQRPLLQPSRTHSPLPNSSKREEESTLLQQPPQPLTEGFPSQLQEASPPPPALPSPEETSTSLQDHSTLWTEEDLPLLRELLPSEPAPALRSTPTISRLPPTALTRQLWIP